jgi:hypothetical protein
MYGVTFYKTMTSIGSPCPGMETASVKMLLLESEYAIRKVPENQVELKLIGAHQLLAYADDVNLLGDNMDTIKKNRNFN